MPHRESAPTQESLNRGSRIYLFDFDGTLSPSIKIQTSELPAGCTVFNQWSVPCFLLWQHLHASDTKQTQKPNPEKDFHQIAYLYGQFQTTFINWIYDTAKGTKYELQIPDSDIYDPKTITQEQINLAQAFKTTIELAQQFYETLNEAFSFKLWWKQAKENLGVALFKKVYGDSRYEPIGKKAYTSHLKDMTWLMATFEIWDRFSITPDDLQEYAKFLSNHFKQKYLAQIAQALLDGDTIVINTFGVEEVSLEATRLALQNYFIEWTGSEEEAKDFITIIDQAIEEGRLSTTGESYKEFLQIKAIGNQIGKELGEDISTLKLITTVLKHLAENTKGKQEDTEVQEIINALSPEQLKQIQNYITSRTLPFDATGLIISTGVGKAIRVFKMHMPNTTNKIQEISAIGDSGTTDGPMIRMAQALNVLWFPGTLDIDPPSKQNHDQANYSPLPQTRIVPKYTIEIKELNDSDTNA